jgi:ABC-type glycerol-3-phosphate transport system substrate-binding protein
MFEQIKSNRKLQIIIAVIVALSMVLIGLFLAQPKKQTATAVRAVPITLNWWKPFYGGEVYDKIIDDFTKLPQNKDVKINLIKKPYDNSTNVYYKNFLQDQARGTGPDIFTLKNDDLPAYKEFCTPINNVRDEKGSFVPDPKLLADYKEKFVNLVAKDTIDRNQIYAITSYVENLQLYYNENLLKQAGIVVPPTSWADLDRQLSLLNKKEIGGLQFSRNAISMGTGIIAKPINGQAEKFNVNRFQDILPMLIFQNGGQMYDKNTKKVLFGQARDQKDVKINQATTKDFDEATKNENPSFQALNFYTSFANDKSSRYSWAYNSSLNIDAFTQGRLAYMINYSYFQNTIKEKNSNLQYSVAKLPQLDQNNKRTYGFFFMDCASSKLKEKADTARDPISIRKYQVAKDFLYYLSTPKIQEKFAVATGLPSAHKDVVSKQQINSNRINRIFAEGAIYADNYYKPDVKRAEKIWGDMMYRIQFENMSLEKSLTIAIKEYTDIVKDGPKVKG